MTDHQKDLYHVAIHVTPDGGRHPIAADPQTRQPPPHHLAGQMTQAQFTAITGATDLTPYLGIITGDTRSPRLYSLLDAQYDLAIAADICSHHTGETLYPRIPPDEPSPANRYLDVARTLMDASKIAYPNIVIRNIQELPELDHQTVFTTQQEESAHPRPEPGLLPFAFRVDHNNQPQPLRRTAHSPSVEGPHIAGMMTLEQFHQMFPDHSPFPFIGAVLHVDGEPLIYTVVEALDDLDEIAHILTNDSGLTHTIRPADQDVRQTAARLTIAIKLLDAEADIDKAHVIQQASWIPEHLMRQVFQYPYVRTTYDDTHYSLSTVAESMPGELPDVTETNIVQLVLSNDRIQVTLERDYRRPQHLTIRSARADLTEDLHTFNDNIARSDEHPRNDR